MITSNNSGRINTLETLAECWPLFSGLTYCSHGDNLHMRQCVLPQVVMAKCLHVNARMESKINGQERHSFHFKNVHIYVLVYPSPLKREAMTSTPVINGLSHLQVLACR